MCSAGDDAALPAPGFPIRESAGHRLFSASPRLIAAVHALHRLLVPRHPPRALTILTVIEPKWFGDTRCWCDRDCSRSLWLLCSFQGSPEAYASRRTVPCRDMRGQHPARAGLSKLNSMPASSTARLKRGERGNDWPVRFGRRARPDDRSNGPEWAGGLAGAPYGAP
jgi:hypothetical protein